MSEESQHTQDTASHPSTGAAESEHVEHDADGNVSMRGPLRDGKMDGEFSFFQHGKLFQKSHYKDDQLDGESIEYFPSGKVCQRVHFKAGKITGLLRRFDEQGRPELLAAYVQGELHGDMVTYENGQMQSQQHHVKGKKHGVGIIYSPDGSPLLSAQFQNDKRHGEAVYFGPRGVVVRREPYVEGLIHGTVQDFMPDGRLRESSQYVAGKLHGESLVFHPNGKLQRRTRYEQGLPSVRRSSLMKRGVRFRLRRD